MGRLPRKFSWNLTGTKSFPRRKHFNFQNFLRFRTAHKLCFCLAPYRSCLRCYHSSKKTFKSKEIRTKQQIPPLYKALCSARSHLPSLCPPAGGSMLLALCLSAAFLAAAGRTADSHPSGVRGVHQSKILSVYWWLSNDLESFKSWQCFKYLSIWVRNMWIFG